MIKNFLKIGFRSLLNNKLVSVINLVGLSIGISACIIIFSVAHYEFSYENFRSHSDKIFRITSKFKDEDGNFYYNSGISSPIPLALEKELKGVESSALIHGLWTSVLVPQKDNSNTYFSSPDWTKSGVEIVTCPPSFFEIIEQEWIMGDASSSLSRPNTVVLTKSKMQKYFGDISAGEAIGRELIYLDSVRVSVTGIVADQPINTDFQYTDFISFATIAGTTYDEAFGRTQWTNTNSDTQYYVKLDNGIDPEVFEKQFSDLVASHFNVKEKYAQNRTFEIQNLKDIHFNLDYIGDFYEKADLDKIYMLFLVAAFILLMAVINFVNLSTAKSLSRMKEMGVRKVLGSTKAALIGQVLTETGILVIAAVLIALLISSPLVSGFQNYFPQNFKLEFSSLYLLIFMLSLIILLTIFCGLYPGYVISKYNPQESLKLKANSSSGNGSWNIRKFLIVFQFGMAQLFVIGSLTVLLQNNFLINKDMGFKKETILYFNLNWEWGQENNVLFAEKLKKVAGLEELSLCELPARSGSSTTTLNMQNNGSTFELITHQKEIDKGFIPLFGLELLAGQNFSNTDTTNSFIVNETFTKKAGFNSPQEAIGHLIDYRDTKFNKIKFPIIGVIKDYNFRSLHNAIEPILFKSELKYCRSIAIQTNSKNKEDLQAKINGVFKEIYPQKHILPKLEFFDKSIEQFYNKEIKTSKLLYTSTIISILISCLGLFGLVVFSIQQRTKELGIRKVLGAGITSIVQLLSQDFFKLIAVAFLIATPLSYYFAKLWLQDFAYRIDLSWWIFIAGGAITLIFALFTVTFQVVSAAKSNPVEALRNE